VRSAVIGLAKTLSRELARDNILINNVCPGRIDTERAQKLNKARADRVNRPVEEINKEMAAEVPLGRYGTAEDSLNDVVPDTQAGNVHEVSVNGLQPDTTYDEPPRPLEQVHPPWRGRDEGFVPLWVRVDTTARKIAGTKEFDWVLTPRIAGELDVPPIRYPYFNPDSRRYQVASTNPARCPRPCGCSGARSSTNGRTGMTRSSISSRTC